jgi:ATP-dependent Clp protease ATP-binding subunit ClpC
MRRRGYLLAYRTTSTVRDWPSRWMVRRMVSPTEWLRRTVSRAVEQALADRIAAGTAHPGTVYTADVDADGHIILTEDTLAACV